MPEAKQSRVTRIVLVDDHNLFRAGLRALIEREQNLSVVAEAERAQQGLETVASHGCDLVIVDYNLPDHDGPWLIQQLTRQNPDLPTLLLTQHVEADKVRQVMDCGCHGYLIKGADERELLTAIEVVAAGGIYVHPSVAHALIGPRRDEVVLSERESSIIELLTRGKSNKEMAQLLHVSLGTIKNDLSLLYQRLKVSDRTQLVAEAIAMGLVKT